MGLYKSAKKEQTRQGGQFFHSRDILQSLYTTKTPTTYQTSTPPAQLQSSLMFPSPTMTPNSFLIPPASTTPAAPLPGNSPLPIISTKPCITRKVLPATTKVLNDVEKSEAKINRSIVSQHVRDTVENMQMAIEREKRSGMRFPKPRRANRNYRRQNQRSIRFDPKPVVDNFKFMVTKGKYTTNGQSKSKTFIKKAADWMLMGRKGWAHFMYVMLLAKPEEIMSAIAILNGPDILNDPLVATSAKDHLHSALPAPLAVLTSLPKV